MRRNDIHKVLIIGSGPIIIGQACEFDYSGTQACKALRKLGYEIVLVNSNPATIMTDPETADVTYIEPLNVDRLTQIIEKERPDALLPNLGGQSGLNLCSELAAAGVLDKYDVKVIGVQVDAIERGEDRIEFKHTMESLGIEMARSEVAYSVEDALAIADKLGYPVVLRPAYTMGGEGGGLVYNVEELKTVCARGLQASMVGQVLVEESILGWEELELEVVRDAKNNMITVCFIENIDPLGVHTGDSFCSAPMLTISEEVQKRLQEKSYKIVEAIQVIGGTNVQWAHDPKTDRDIVIEINPRTSRSSALASKATGFPIALVSAMLATGMTLDEIPCGKSGTLDQYVPSGDYIVIKFARWAFEKFKGAEDKLGTQMKAVGEVMSIGKTYKEAFQKAIRSLERGRYGLGHAKDFDKKTKKELLAMLHVPSSERQFIMYEALRKGATVDELFELTKIKHYFIQQMKELVEEEESLMQYKGEVPPVEVLRQAKLDGFADKYLSELLGVTEEEIRDARTKEGIVEGWEGVHVSATPDSAYYFSSYHIKDQSPCSDNKKIMILGGGPNRIGQGIEFDYCCVHASMALREDGYETIMVNCNPETVSTDYDTSDRLYFEPVTLEDVLEIIDVEKPEGVIVQYGGQTPLKLARALEANGVNIIGTTPDSIDAAEDRERFQHLLQNLGLHQPPNRTARTEEEAIRLADEIGYPLVVRPSYVLGGRAMDIVHDRSELERYMREAIKVSFDSPVLLDRFLDDAVEMDVDAVSDGKEVRIGGVMQHIEQAGVHSGDSACSIPPYSLDPALVEEVKRQTREMARALNVVGLMNVQFAIQHAFSDHPEIFVLEVNPRASRTVPFVSKSTGQQLAKIAARCMVGQSLEDQKQPVEVDLDHYSVKEAVFPFAKFLGVDPVLGPEMRSTGEVMGVGRSFGEALFKSQLGADSAIPKSGRVFISVKEEDKPRLPQLAKNFTEAGYQLVATRGTAKVIREAGYRCDVVNKVSEGRPNIVDELKNGNIQLVIAVAAESRSEIADASAIRIASLANHVTFYTAMANALAVIEGIRHMKDTEVYAQQELHKHLQH